MAVIALIGSAIMLMSGSSTPAGATGIVPPSKPATNIAPQVMPACSITPVDDDSSGCIDSVLHNINYARYLEGLGPLVLPIGYAGDPVPEQQLIITDEERGDRGLPGFTGLDPALDTAAQTAAAGNTDPAPPTGFDYTSAGSIFALDYTPLGADFAWMYNDGYGGTNVDCTSSTGTECWGHRDNILGPWATTGSQTADMGDANTAAGQYTEIFANEAGTPDSLIDPIVPSALPTPSTPATPDVVQVLPASSPNTGAGTPVTIEGNYFGTTPAPQVFFGGVPATNVQVNWDGQLTADAPADPAGTSTDRVVVTVITGAGSSSSTGTPGVDEFTYVPTDAPIVTSVSPTSGLQVPSGSVTIEGSNFNDGATPIVDFGTVASIGSMSYSPNEITTTIPGSVDLGTVHITVTTPAGTSAQSPADLYTYSDTPAPSPPPPPPAPTPPTVSHGYWLVGSDGGIFNFGSAGFHGSTGSMRLQRPVVGITPTSDRNGYWLVASDGGIFAFGDAGFFGSIPGAGLHPAGSGMPNSLNAPIVGMVPSSDGGGYFMVASDGGVFAFGDAKFAGSCPGIGGCNGKAVAVMPDATGNGYWVVTSSGSVYPFGDAVDYGAPGPQAGAITSAAATPDGDGYWILSGNGQVFNFGNAAALGGAARRFGRGARSGQRHLRHLRRRRLLGGDRTRPGLGLRRRSGRRGHGGHPPQRPHRRGLGLLTGPPGGAGRYVVRLPGGGRGKAAAPMRGRFGARSFGSTAGPAQSGLGRPGRCGTQGGREVAGRIGLCRGARGEHLGARPGGEAHSRPRGGRTRRHAGRRRGGPTGRRRPLHLRG